MTEFIGKGYLSFQAKVILPVVLLLVLFLAIILWLVNRRLTDQFEEETRQTLMTAEAVFKNSFEIRTRNLLLRYQSLANEPRFKAVAQLADSKTMTVQLNELLQEIGPEAKVMIFTTGNNLFLAAARNEQGMNVREFYAHSIASIREALQGRPATATTAVGQYLLNTISVPVFVNDALAGVLTIGEAIGPAAAKELKSLTRTEIVFLASSKVALSTLQNHDFYPQFAVISSRLNSPVSQAKSSSSRKMEAVAVANQHFLCLSGNFANSSGDLGYLLLSSYEKALREKEVTQRTLTVLSLIGILFASLLLWVLIRKITRPLRQLRDSAEAVGRGDFSRRVEIHSKDECGELAGVFNRMTENLKTSQAEAQQAMQSLKDTQAQLIQTEKLSAMGEFVAGIAHELNNPLTGVIGFSQMLQESGISEHQQTFLDRITDSAERCRKIVQNLLSFSRRHRPERKWVDINELLESALEILEYELTTSNIQVITELSQKLPAVEIDPHQIQQVFLNIIHNAKQAIQDQPEGGTLQISTELVRDQIRIRFSDNGPGIAAKDLADVFNPFFTTKPVGVGTGLGLSLSYGIIREHGGDIKAESRPGKGASFTIDLPVSPGDQQIQTTGLSVKSTFPKSPQRPCKKILVIDDEKSILELIREALRSHGYQVDTALEGNRALELAALNSYDLVVCDWKIPGAGGQRIYEQLREMKPEAVQRFVFITGDILSPKAEQFLQTEAKICLSKPFSIEEFRRTIEKIFADS